MNSTEEETTNVWSAAQQKCWHHVEIATDMTKLLESLKGLHVSAVIPILSDSRPTLMLTPDAADDLVAIKATVRYITQAVGLPDTAVWDKISVGDEWCLRLTTTAGITIDVMTRLPATKESPIEV